MDRRQFLKGAAAFASLAAFSRLTLASSSFTSEQYWVFINAQGGWDTTSICDPKGNIEFSANHGVINRYNQSDIRQVGNFKLAPMLTSSYSGPDHMATFFSQQQAYLRVFNGLDFATNSHDAGMRASLTGSHSASYPTSAAIIASLNKEQYLMPYYLAVGYGNTAGLVNASRLDNLSRLQDFTNPDRFLPSSVTDAINQRNQQKLDSMSDSTVDAELQAISDYRSAHANGSDLKRLQDRLPTSPSSDYMKMRAEITAASFAAELSNTASMGFGSFDTHSNNDEKQAYQIAYLFEVVNHLISELERQGIADKTNIVIGSDFGRTPYYNPDNGKDHWNVGSMMIWSKQSSGNLQIGATDNQVNALAVDPNTLETSENGVILTPGHLHLAIRQKMGIDENNHISFQFPLGMNFVDVLG
ncbi:DUF1501 domain-containing protein [Vibrio sp.]|uniref:DUF1501 domain-containing protein n=1 Tax=Vibrio sp. TaxID=678 RepID=UPI003D0BFCD7